MVSVCKNDDSLFLISRIMNHGGTILRSGHEASKRIAPIPAKLGGLGFRVRKLMCLPLSKDSSHQQSLKGPFVAYRVA